MKICGSERDRNQWPSRYCGGSGAGSDTPSGSQHPAPHAKPQGKRKRGRPRNSWRRDTEAELKQQGTNWSGMTRAAQNRVRWRGVVDGLCSTGSDGHKYVSKCQFAGTTDLTVAKSYNVSLHSTAKHGQRVCTSQPVRLVATCKSEVNCVFFC